MVNDYNHHQIEGQNGYYVYYPGHYPHENWQNNQYQPSGEMYNNSRSNSQPAINYGRSNYNDPAVIKNMFSQFLDEKGQVDIQKTLQTVGQFADTVQQVSPVIKQLNELVQSMRTK